MKLHSTSLFRILFSFKPIHTLPLSSPAELRFHSTINEAATRDTAVEVFRHWGCTGAEIQRILTRCPKLQTAKNVAKLDSNLELLRGFGDKPSDLIAIIQRRPDFAVHRINRYFEKPLDRFESLFGSREMLIKAFVRNPSLLCYDFDTKVAPLLEMYNKLGGTNCCGCGCGGGRTVAVVVEDELRSGSATLLARIPAVSGESTDAVPANRGDEHGVSAN